jgi:hypothetical protein
LFGDLRMAATMKEVLQGLGDEGAAAETEI